MNIDTIRIGDQIQTWHDGDHIILTIEDIYLYNVYKTDFEFMVDAIHEVNGNAEKTRISATTLKFWMEDAEWTKVGEE